MENQQKEQLRKEFEIQYANHPANLFEWFWKRLEEKEDKVLSDYKASLEKELRKECDEIQEDKISINRILELLNTCKPTNP